MLPHEEYVTNWKNTMGYAKTKSGLLFAHKKRFHSNRVYKVIINATLVKIDDKLNEHFMKDAACLDPITSTKSTKTGFLH